MVTKSWSVLDAVQWCAYRSPWGRFIHWAGYWLDHGETRAQAVARNLALADQLDSMGRHADADRLRRAEGV